MYPINTHYIRCIWGWFIKGPPSQGFSHHFPYETGIWHVGIPLRTAESFSTALSTASACELRQPLGVINHSCVPGSHECNLCIYCGGWILKKSLFQSKWKCHQRVPGMVCGSLCIYVFRVLLIHCFWYGHVSLSLSPSDSKLGRDRDPKPSWSTHFCWVKIA